MKNKKNKRKPMRQDKRKPRDLMDLLVLMMLLFVTLAAILALFVIARRYSERPQREDFVPVVRTVQRGETAWSIAEDYCPDSLDKRLYLDWCAEINGKPMGYIQAGEHVVFLEVIK
ncbi:MAG: hypothetical protein ACI4RV_01355 [Eubacteriales bacterium]